MPGKPDDRSDSLKYKVTCSSYTCAYIGVYFDNIVHSKYFCLCYIFYGAVGRRPIIGHTAPCNIYTPVHISYYFILLLMYYIVQIYIYMYLFIYVVNK